MVQMVQRQRFDPGGSKASDIWSPKGREPDAQVVSQHGLVKPSPRRLYEPLGNTLVPPPGFTMNKIVIQDADYDSRHTGEERRVDEEIRDFQQQSSSEVDASIIDLTDRDEVCMDPPADNVSQPSPWFGFDWTTASASIGEAFSNLTDTNKSLKSVKSNASMDASKINAATGVANPTTNSMTEQIEKVHSPLTALRKRLEERVQLKGSLSLPVLMSEEFTSSGKEVNLPDLCSEEFNEAESLGCGEVGSVECEMIDGKVRTKPVSNMKVDTVTVVSDEEVLPLSSPIKGLMNTIRASLKGTKSHGDDGSQTSWAQWQGENKESIGHTSWERSRTVSKDYEQTSWGHSQSLDKDAIGLTSTVQSNRRDEADTTFEQNESDADESNQDEEIIPGHGKDPLPYMTSVFAAKCADLVNDDGDETFKQADQNVATPGQEPANNENNTMKVNEQNPKTSEALVKQISVEKEGTTPSQKAHPRTQGTVADPQTAADSPCGCFLCFPEGTDYTAEQQDAPLENLENQPRNQELESIPVRSVLSSLFQCIDPSPSVQDVKVKSPLKVDMYVPSKEKTEKMCEMLDDGSEEEDDDEDPSTLLSATDDLQSLPSVEEDVNDTVPPYQAGDFGLSPKASSADIVERSIKKLDEKIESESIKSVHSCDPNSLHSDGNSVGRTSVKSTVGRFFGNSTVKSVPSDERSVGAVSFKSNHSAGHSISGPILKSNQSAEIASPKSVHSAEKSAAEKSAVQSPYSATPSDGHESPTADKDGAALELRVGDDDKYVTEQTSLDASMETRRAMLIKELRTAISIYGRYDVHCANISAALGDLLVEGEEYNHAIKLHRDSVTIYSCKLGDDHTTTLKAKTRLAAVLESAGEIEEAITIYFQVTSMRRAIFGDQDPSVADGLVCLAHALRKNSDYVPAIKELKRALKIFRESLGDSHEKVATTVDEIASLYVTIGDFTKSAAILEEVVKLKAATMGAKSKEVAATLVQLANAYECSDKFDSAMKVLKKAYKIYTEIVGYSSEEAAATLNRMAQLYEATDDYNRASVAYLGVLRGRKIQRGPNHFSVGETYFHLARALRETKQYEKALKCLKEALPIFVGQGVEMNDVKMVADIMHEMALVSLERGHFQDASRILKQELSVRRKVGQPEFPFAARTLKHLGVTEYTMKNHSKALKYLVEALSIHQEREDQGVECAEVLFHTGLVFYKVNNKERALEAFVEAVRIFNEHGLENYPLNIEANEKIEDIRADMATAHASLPRRFNFAKRFGGGKH